MAPSWHLQPQQQGVVQHHPPIQQCSFQYGLRRVAERLEQGVEALLEPPWLQHHGQVEDECVPFLRCVVLKPVGEPYPEPHSVAVRPRGARRFLEGCELRFIEGLEEF